MQTGPAIVYAKVTVGFLSPVTSRSTVKLATLGSGSAAADIAIRENANARVRIAQRILAIFFMMNTS